LLSSSLFRQLELRSLPEGVRRCRKQSDCDALATRGELSEEAELRGWLGCDGRSIERYCGRWRAAIATESACGAESDGVVADAAASTADITGGLYGRWCGRAECADVSRNAMNLMNMPILFRNILFVFSMCVLYSV